MTINNQQIEITYDWDGVPAELPITFEVYDAIQVKWEVVDNGGAPSNVIAMPQKNADGDWVLNVTGGSAATIRIWRETPITQETDYQPYDAFPAESHEAALDKLTMIAQELEEGKVDKEYVADNFVSKDGDMMNEGNQGLHMNGAQINGLKAPEPQNPFGAVNVEFYQANLIPGKQGPVGPPGPGVEPRPDPGLYPEWELPDTGPDYNPVFWVNDNELHSDYTLRPNANAMSAGPITIADTVTVDTGDGQWTVVGSEDINPMYLGDLLDVETEADITDQYTILWNNTDKMWRPGLSPRGEKGEPGTDGKTAYELYLESTTDEPPLTLEEWLGSGTPGTPGVDGKGWTDGQYDPATGIVTFNSDDGLGFSTSDLRGANGSDGVGTDGKGWTDGQYDPATGIVTFSSDDGLGFSTTDLRGADGSIGVDGKGWTDGQYNPATGIVTFNSDDGLGFSTTDIRGADGSIGVDGKGWTDGQYDPDTGIVTFTSDDGLGFTTGDLRGEDGEPGPGFTYLGNVPDEGSLPASGDIGDAYFVESVGELFAYGEDGSWHSLGAIQGPEGEKGHGWADGSYDAATGVVTFTGDTDSGFLTFSTGDLRAPEPDPGLYPDKDYIDNADKGLQDQIDVIKGDVSQNATDISTNADGISQNATDIGLLEGRVTVNEGNISTNTNNISTNAGNIAQNTTDIGLLDGRVTVNEGDISTNTTDISAIKAQLTPGSHETILTSVDNGDGTYSTTWAPNEHIDDELPATDAASLGDVLTLIDENGVLVPSWEESTGGGSVDQGNDLPWTHGQYNELEVIEGPMTEAVINLHVTPMVHLKPDSGSTVQVRANLPQRPDPDNPGSFLPIQGMTANIVLDMNSTYDFSDPIWNIGTQTYTDLDNDMILSFLSEDSKWHCVGMSYVGADAVVEAGSSGIEEAPEDGNTYVRKDGQWVSGGKVLQVVQAVKTDSFSNTTATLVQIPGLSADITPKSTSSKILVMYSVGMGNNDATGGMKLQLYRDGTEIYLGTTATSENLSSYGGVAGNVDNITNFAGIYLDLPSSTSAVTYSLSAARHTRGSVTINQRGSGLSNVTPSSITLMEIAG